MLKPLIKALGIITGVVLSGVACAVGFGSANVSSALGEPLKAEINLVEVTKAEKNSLFVRMAPPEAYKAAGIDYPYALSKLKFDLEARENGEPYIKVTSTAAVNDPFVTLLVELSWSSGKLLREFTFLLDPPSYKGEQPKAEEVTPIAPAVVAAPPVPAAPELEVPSAEAASAVVAPEAVVAAEAASAPEVTAPAEVTPALAPEVASAPEAAAVEGAPEAAPAPAAPEVAATALAPTPEAAPPTQPEQAVVETPRAPETITVRRGDTLSKIAAQIKEPDVTLEQMLVALYRANTREFDGRNMNRLRAGRILRMPDQSTLERLSQGEAVREIRIQTSNWNAYRQKLAAAIAPVPEEAPKQEAGGKITAAVTDHAPPAKEAAKEVLKLSKGEAPGDHLATAGKAGAAAEKQAKEEEAIAQRKAAEEATKRGAMVEKNIQEMQRLIELKGQSAPAASAVSPASAVAGASGIQPAKPAAKPRIIPVPAPMPQPSLLDEVLGNPLYLGGAAAILLALGGAGFYLTRRRSGGGGKKKKFERQVVSEEEIPAEAPSAAIVAAPAAAAAGDFTRTAAGAVGRAAAKPAEPEEVDPIAEADLFLNFGRDAQAEEVLKDALSRDPSNRSIQLKLASIYANRKDANAFSSIARQLQDSGDKAAWEQVAALGRKIDPSNPMYGGGAGAGAGEVPLAAAGPSALDIDLGTAVPMDFDVTGGGAKPETAPVGGLPMDFDLTATPPAAVMDFDVTTRQPLTSIQTDFDVTGSQPNLAATQHMDFDVTGSQPNLATAQQAGMAEPEGLSMDFDISASPLAAVSAPAEFPSTSTAPPLEFGDLMFDVTSPPAAVAEPAAAEAQAMDIGLGGISLDFEPAPTAASAAGEAKDEQWQEVATKLDLAKAYHEMGDADGAREILGEVLRDGDEQQREAANALLEQL